MKWLKALVVVILIGLAVFAVGYGLLTWQTGSSRFLQPAPIVSVTSVATGGDALNAVLDGVGQAATATLQNRDEARRRRAADGLLEAFATLIAITTVLAAAWSLFAWSRTKDVGTQRGQQIAQGAWLAGLVTVVVVAVFVFWTTFSRTGPAGIATGGAKGGMIIVCLLLLWLAYYLGTAFGAPSVLRRSVPLATGIVPMNWNKS